MTVGTRDRNIGPEPRTFCGALVALATFFAALPGPAKAASLVSGLNRMANVAANESTWLVGFLAICVTIGVVLFIDRRRRLRTRRATS